VLDMLDDIKASAISTLIENKLATGGRLMASATGVSYPRSAPDVLRAAVASLNKMPPPRLRRGREEALARWLGINLGVRCNPTSR